MAGGPDRVNVGNNNSVSAIQGKLYIENSSINPSIRNTINIYDSADLTTRTANLSTTTSLPSDPGPRFGSITGLEPGVAAINFTFSDTSAVYITSYANSLTFNVAPTASVSTNSYYVPWVYDNNTKVNHWNKRGQALTLGCQRLKPLFFRHRRERMNSVSASTRKLTNAQKSLALRGQKPDVQVSR